MRGDDGVCLSDDDGLKHIDSLLKPKHTAKDMRTLGFADSDVKSLLLLNCVLRVGTAQIGQYLDIEPDLRHAPLIISESGCNANTGDFHTWPETDWILQKPRNMWSEPREFDFVPLQRAARYLVGRPKAAL